MPRGIDLSIMGPSVISELSSPPHFLSNQRTLTLDYPISGAETAANED